MIRSYFVLFLLLCSFGTPFSKNQNKNQIESLQKQIDKIIQDVDPHLHIGMEVISLENGQKLYQKNEAHLFTPASSQKIFTGAAALAILGVDYRFETKLLTDGEIKEGVLVGNLYLKGVGDPELSIHDLEDLIFQLKVNQIKKVQGNFIVDHFDFDALPQGPGWMWDEEIAYWNSPMDALTVNHSCVNLWIRAAEEAAQPPHVFVYPKTDYVSVQNFATTSENEDGLVVERNGSAKENLIQVKGPLLKDSSLLFYKIPIDNPHLYTASLFIDLLKRYGIEWVGQLEEQATPLDAKELASHASSPLSLIVHKMLKTSDNLAANCLFKKIGQARFGAPGTWPKGGQAIRDFLQSQAGIDVTNLILLDGDGESRYNLASAHQIVSFLGWAYKQFKFSAEFLGGLPLSGIDGSLRTRMRDSSVKGRVRAKSGTMTGISSLSGYVKTKEGEMLAFSILTNGFVKPCREYETKLEDQICMALANFSRTKME